MTLQYWNVLITFIRENYQHISWLTIQASIISFKVAFTMLFPFRMTFTQNKINSTDDIEKPFIVCYKPLITVLFFTFTNTNVGQRLELMAFKYIFWKMKKNSSKFYAMIKSFLHFEHITINFTLYIEIQFLNSSVAK